MCVDQGGALRLASGPYGRGWVLPRAPSPLHRLDPRAKLMACLVVAVISVSLRTFPPLLASAFLSGAFLLLARVRAGFILARVTAVLPFLGMLFLSALGRGTGGAILVSLRSLSAFLALTVLASTTSREDLSLALEAMGLPTMLVRMMEFTLRYFELLSDEFRRMMVARKARGFRVGRNLWDGWTMRMLAQGIGILFLRALERGERVYRAMLARGFSGEAAKRKKPRAGKKDYLYAMGVFLAALLLWLWDRGWMGVSRLG